MGEKMTIIGIIAEYNPFHHGHAYHIKKIKELYPDSLIILVLNGYFLERGETSVLNKETKIKIALQKNVDLVIELPFVFGTQAADVFAETAVTILNHLKTEKIVFGSESNDPLLLTELAEKQLTTNFNSKIKSELSTGISYPTALNKALGINLNTPNDLLGIAYIKAILKNKFKIEPITIQRTNDYHDLKSNAKIISASNIREKFHNQLDITKYTDYADKINLVNNDLLFNLLKYKILTDHDLSKYLTVDEGIEAKLIKEINNCHNINDLILKVKSKRYTYNRIQRMLTHILIGLTKEDKNYLAIEYIKLLGFNNQGKKYINKIRKELTIPLTRKISDDYLAQKYELKAAMIYDLITGNNTIQFELANRPINKDSQK